MMVPLDLPAWMRDSCCLGACSQRILFMVSVGMMALEAVQISCMVAVLFAFFPLSICVESGTPRIPQGSPDGESGGLPPLVD